MNEILNTALYTIVFVIPGFIIMSITSRIIPQRDKEYSIKILDFFVYSSINAILWAIPIYKIIRFSDNIEKHYISLWILLILIMFISPIAISLIIIYFNKISLLKKITNHLGIKLIEIEPSAWDYKFSKMEAEWVIITLKDNKVVAGFLGNVSCISSSNTERDIYINEVYTISENNEWNRVNRTNGIYIKSDEIKYVEFFKDERRNV